MLHQLLHGVHQVVERQDAVVAAVRVPRVLSEQVAEKRPGVL